MKSYASMDTTLEKRLRPDNVRLLTTKSIASSVYSTRPNGNVVDLKVFDVSNLI
jgi:hypothetical protein